MELNEAETQLLALLARASDEGAARDREALDKSGERYWIYRQDLAPAFASLAARGLIGGDDAGYSLTAVGEPLARDCFAKKPDRYCYYYHEFYGRAHLSRAHSRLCEQVFGQDLCQEGQMDMAAVDDLLQRIDLQPGQHLLDLGCGAGGISRYMAERTGARVTGMDYSADAVAVARQRAADSSAQLDFVQGDLNGLQLPRDEYDAVVMIDTIYWAADTAKTLQQIIDALAPGGKLVVIIAIYPAAGDDPRELEIDGNFVARALDSIGVAYDSVDDTAAFIDFWRRQKRALDELREDFFAEGNEFIHLSLSTEAETEFLPAIEAGKLRRYLYEVRR
jgi:SAM-dependent methyltransferase